MIPVSYIDYQKCHEYARTMGGICHIPRCDWDDLGSDAFLLAIKRSHRAGECKNIESAANRLMYNSVIDVIRRRNTLANKMIRQADDIDKINSDSSDAALTLRSEDDEAVDDARSCEAVEGALSRGCISVKCTTPTAGVETADDWQNPMWLRLFKYQRSKLKGILKIIVKLLMKDSRLPLARAAIGISRPTFLKNIQKLRKHFDQCFQVLRAWRSNF